MVEHDKQYLTFKVLIDFLRQSSQAKKATKILVKFHGDITSMFTG